MSQKIVFSSAVVGTRGTLERPLPTVSSEVQAKPELAVESLATGKSHVIVIYYYYYYYLATGNIK